MTIALYDKHERIATITLNRPDAMNALDDTLNESLWAIWADFEADPEVDVAILTGNGRAFCAGADLKTFIPKWEHATLREARDNARHGIGGGLTRGQHRITKPVIAAINGAAIGGGFELALACDIRIAADTAKFGVFEVRQGLHQGDGGLVRLLAIAGLGVALDLTLTGREVLADEALRLGLVNRVVAADQVMATAESYARMMLGNSQNALRSAKETLHDLIGRSLDDALRLENFNAYSTDFNDVRARLERFFDKPKQ